MRPHLVSGAMLVKQLDSLCDAQATGIVLGARVPKTAQLGGASSTDAGGCIFDRLCSFESPVGLSGPAGPAATERSP